jgi:AcrR family transcriptional regulator
MELNEKQKQIMDKALEVFAGKGYEVSSVRDIAQHADVNVAMISYYFGSKEKLLEAIFKQRTAYMQNAIETIIHSKTHNEWEKVDQLIDTYITVITKNSAFHKLMMREQVLIKDGPLFQYIKEMKSKNAGLLEIAVRAGQKAGIFQKNVDLSMLAATLLGSVNYVLMNHKILCADNNIGETDTTTFDEKIVNKLRSHLKIMFKAFLTYGIPNKK